MSTTAGVDRATLAGRDYIETIDWSVAEIDEALAVAGELKAALKEGRPHRLLPDKTLYMLFLDKSTRTRNAFETGMTQLGGHAIFLDSDKTQVSHGESPKDTGIILSRYGDGIAIRHDLAPYEGNAWMREIAQLGGHPAHQPPVRHRPPDADARRPDDAARAARREPARAEGRDDVGVRALLREAAVGAAGRRDALPALRDGRRRRASARLRADARGDREGARRPPPRRRARVTFVDRMEEAFADADVVYPKSWGRLDAFTDELEGARRVGRVRRLDLRRAPDGAREAGRALHALPAGRPRPRGDRRGDRRPAVGRLRRGREPDAHRQGADGADDGRLRGVEMAASAQSSRSAATR